MTCRLPFCCLLVGVTLWSPLSLDAAPQVPAEVVIEATDPPAHVAFVEGTVVLEREGQSDPDPANMPLLAGDRLRTRAGRAEVLFGDGSTLHLDANTIVDFQSDTLLRLLDGRLRITIPGPARQVDYRIDAPSASVEITQPGSYRVSVLHGSRTGEIELAVLRGAAEIVNTAGRTALRAGERAFARTDAAPSVAYAFNSATWDAFDRWSEVRADDRRTVSTQYLPEPVRPYASSFARYGDWRTDPAYGQVWYPSVSLDWRPYYNGRWETLRPYGWTWVGADPWAWPTHHYGRWGVSAGAWFWIPGRSWAPAWVSWAYAPGYVSWCPLGWNNRAVVHVATTRGYDPWRAWTAAPRQHFSGTRVTVRGVATRVVDTRTRGFIEGQRPPARAGDAVPRSVTPIRSAGRAAGTPVYTNLSPSASHIRGGPRVMVGSTPTPPAAGSRPTTRETGVAVQRSPSMPRPMLGDDGGRARTWSDTVARPERPAMPERDPYAVDGRTPARRAVPMPDRPGAAPSPSGVPNGPEPTGAMAPWGRAPRASEPDGPPTYRRDMPSRRGPDEGPPPGAVRAAPRGVPQGGPPATSPRAAPERRAPEARPAGPPPGARDSGDRGPSARPRSEGQGATGTAVRRR